MNNEKIASEFKSLENEIVSSKAQLQDRCNKIEEENIKDTEIVKDAINDLTIAFNETGVRA